MRFTSRTIAASAAILTGCNWAPSTAPEVADKDTSSLPVALDLSATNTVMELVRGRPVFLVVLHARNRGESAITLTYPATCPVRVRLYRLADTTLAYDETRRQCDQATIATVRIDPGKQWDIGSGFRDHGAVAGDSLPGATYIVRAVVSLDQVQSREISAGTVLLVPSS
jgi:hypothetical protein